MDLKNWIGNLFGFNQEINQLKINNHTLETKYINTITLLENEQRKSELFKEELQLLTNQYNLLLKNEESEEASYWNNKYPKANIEYSGRTFGTSKDKIPIDVRLFIQPQDFHIHDILKNKNLYYKSGSVDDHIIKIYHFIKQNYYKYVFDQNNYSIDEYWEFPFEMLEGLKRNLTTGYDCDSWAHFIASFLIASGVPEWKVRVVVGMSKLGGHSTIYVHCDKTNKFHHINSTYGHLSSQKDLSKYPTTDDANTTDTIGIYNVWFSFNGTYSWHKFSSQAKQEYKEENGKEIYKIK